MSREFQYFFFFFLKIYPSTPHNKSRENNRNV